MLSKPSVRDRIAAAPVLSTPSRTGRTDGPSVRTHATSITSSPSRGARCAFRTRPCRGAVQQVACAAGAAVSGLKPRLRTLERAQRRRTAAAIAATLSVALIGALLPAAPIRRIMRVASTVPTAAAGAGGDSSPAPVHLAVVAPLDEMSQFGATWREVLEHTAQRLAWEDPTFSLAVLDSSAATSAPETLRAELAAADVALALHVQDAGAAAALAPMLLAAPTAVAVDSAPALAGVKHVGGKDLSEDAIAPGIGGRLAALLSKLRRALPGGGGSSAAGEEDRSALDLVSELYARRTSDDLLFCFLVLVNQAVRPVPAVANSTTGSPAGPGTLRCMVGKCGREIAGCLADASCRTALGCLNSCRFNDQVCSYRCIASYESPALEAFSLCILQKHNCLGLDAKIPALPDPAPMASFRGEPLTHEVAEDLLIGWLREPTSKLERPGGEAEGYSWRVFAGKNPAYDYFPFQSQLFYRGKARGSFWYQPVFQVLTLAGRAVWRQRLYRVRRGPAPGTFKLSVLDNGVTSNEFWRVLDCSEDLSWCAFYYSGAASAAGLSYTGAILTSRDGAWPQGEAARRRIEAALDRAGIKPWELSTVRWDGAGGDDAPLTPAPVALV